MYSIRFRNNLLERKGKLITTINDKIRDENLQYDINRETLSAVLSSKTDKYENLVVKEIISSAPEQRIPQAKFTYFPLGKRFGKKNTCTLKSLKLPYKINVLE